MLKDKSAATDAFQILILIRKSLFRFSLSDTWKNFILRTDWESHAENPTFN